MSQFHTTRLRVVTLTWTSNPNRQVPLIFSVPQVLQLDNLSDPARVRVVDHVQSFERMVVPYVMNFAEATRAGLVVRRPRLVPRYVRINGQSDTFHDVADWPAPELFIWQATDDLLHVGRAADGVDVRLTGSPFNDVDLVMSVTFRPGVGDSTLTVGTVVPIPVSR